MRLLIPSAWSLAVLSCAKTYIIHSNLLWYHKALLTTEDFTMAYNTQVPIAGCMQYRRYACSNCWAHWAHTLYWFEQHRGGVFTQTQTQTLIYNPACHCQMPFLLSVCKGQGDGVQQHTRGWEAPHLHKPDWMGSEVICSQRCMGVESPA